MKAILKQTFSIFRRELGEYFSSPVFYVVAALFHLLQGIMFVQLLADMAQTSATPSLRAQYIGELNISQFVLTTLFDLSNLWLLFIAPALTMRLFAEEKSSGSFELLVSTPVPDWAILIGKTAAAYAAIAVLALSMVLYPLMAQSFGAVEWGLVWSALVGLLLLGAAYVTIGVFASSLTGNQVIAAVVAFGAIMFFAFLLATFGPAGSQGWGNAVRSFSFAHRTRHFYEGAIGGEDILYFTLFSGLCLFATARVLEARRWKR
jgi:ABC-2 type transport system permease protein